MSLVFVGGVGEFFDLVEIVKCFSVVGVEFESFFEIFCGVYLAATGE